ncbi:MAG TPA: Gfo/Idh/MocA family oxidoreductase [Chloroflexota bacterium]|nr:Gfo/Idh/MocA family oxidoreductase [Chloroflexota bacterium]
MTSTTSVAANVVPSQALPPQPATRTVRVGVVGAGYWGPNLIRNFAALPDVALAMICDLDPKRLHAVGEHYPDVALTTNYQDLLDSDLDAIAIATPVKTHYSLVKQALLAGKHVLVEKPLTANVRQAAELVSLAAERNLLLMVDHTMVLSPAVQKLCELVRAGELGEIWHISMERLALGLFRRDVNVLWDLAPHDISILLEVLGTEPTAVSARGAAHVQPGIQDVAYVELRFPGDVMAHVHVSWLDPGKVRSMTVIGSKKMAVLDDVAEDKLTVYDRGVDSVEANGRAQLVYRFGEGERVGLPKEEPLRRQCAEFVSCIASGEWPAAYAEQGLNVVRILEQADRSLQNSGHREALGWDAAGWRDALAPVAHETPAARWPRPVEVLAQRRAS